MVSKRAETRVDKKADLQADELVALTVGERANKRGALMAEMMVVHWVA